MVEYLPSIAQVEVAAAGRAAHEMFGCIFWLVAYAARAILAKAAQHHAGHIVARARESSCACFRAMECRSPWRPSRPRISNSTRRRGPGRCEPCNFLMFGTAVSKSGVAVGPSGHANSPHPSSREGHHSTAGWSSTFLLSRLILRGRHAAAASRVQRNSVPSTQMRCMITANRRASATIAFFIPRRRAICIAQALSQDHFFDRSML